MWVNGFVVAGNWSDPAFTMRRDDLPTSLYLLEGTSYGVRIEYLRPDTLDTDSSAFTLEWSKDGGANWSDLTGQLHPAAQRSGAGLLGTFAPCNDPSSGSCTTGRRRQHLAGRNAAAVRAGGRRAVLGTFRRQIVPPISGDYTFSADSDGAVTIRVNDQQVFIVNQPQDLNSKICAHDICQAGGPISRTCNLHNFCAFNVCKADPNCCSISWDARCVEAVASVCKVSCLPELPKTISLRAGTKYQVTADYAHGISDDPTKPKPRGAKLRLMWSLPGAAREVVPIERLFAPRSATAGTGINAAYFEDETTTPFKFKNEYLDRVVDAPSFQIGSLPGPVRGASIVCGVDGLAACEPGGDRAGPPAVVSPSAGATVFTTTSVTGRAARGALVDLLACRKPPNQPEVCDVPLGSQTTASDVCDLAAGSTTTCGAFTIDLTSLTPGTLRFRAKQTVGGTTSDPSDQIEVHVVPNVDTAAPTSAPTVNQPPAGLVSTDRSVSVGGTAAPIANSTVVVKVNGTEVSFPVDATTGAWGGSLTLEPGNYDLTFAQRVGTDHTGPASASVNVKVSLPALTLTSPAGDLEIVPPASASIAVSGTADPLMGPVIIVEGDGRFFVDRTTVPVNSTGAFNLPSPLPLDYGRHQMKFFQRKKGLDGPPALRTISVLPPAIAPGITSPKAGDPVVSPFIVKGDTGLTNSPLPGRVFIYARRPLESPQSAVKVAEGPLRSDGGFEISVPLTGAGEWFLTAKQVATSLSGGGTAESGPTAEVSVILTPGAPTIDEPDTGFQKLPTGSPDDLLVDVSGTAEPGTHVLLSVDGVMDPGDGIPILSDRHFSTTIELQPGTHTLTAFAEVLGVLSLESKPPVVVTVGDVKGPTLTATPVLCDGSQPECLGQPDATGVDVSFASRVTVEDDGSTKPLCAPGQTPTTTAPCVVPCGSGVTNSCFTCTPRSAIALAAGRDQRDLHGAR